MRSMKFATLLLASASLTGCAAWKPPEIKYDDTPHQAVLVPDPPKPIEIVPAPAASAASGAIEANSAGHDRAGGHQ